MIMFQCFKHILPIQDEANVIKVEKLKHHHCKTCVDGDPEKDQYHDVSSVYYIGHRLRWQQRRTETTVRGLSLTFRNSFDDYGVPILQGVFELGTDVRLGEASHPLALDL